MGDKILEKVRFLKSDTLAMKLATIAVCILSLGYILNFIEGADFSFSMILAIAPPLLLVIAHYVKAQSTILVSVACGLPILSAIINMIDNDDTILSGVIVSVLFALATWSVLRGLKQKLFVLIACAVAIIAELWLFFDIIALFGLLLEAGYVLFVISCWLIVIGSVLYYVALAVYALNNRVPTLVMASAKDVATQVKDSFSAQKELSPEQELKVLKDKLELGIITEEEYKEKRAEIINKL